MLPVAIALGSNEGDRLANLRMARAKVLELRNADARDEAEPLSRACLSAPIFETAPVNCPPEAGFFLNTVIEVAFGDGCSIAGLLADLRGIETALGRPTRYPRNAPRTVDLDILYAGQRVSSTPELSLPHPRIAERRFVLAPLAAIRPELVLPGQSRTVAQLLRDLQDRDAITLYASDW